MPREPNIPCKNPRKTYVFLLDDGRRVLSRGRSESDAAKEIPILFGPSVHWAICVGPGSSGDQYDF
jgi:hypothetical protein